MSIKSKANSHGGSLQTDRTKAARLREGYGRLLYVTTGIRLIHSAIADVHLVGSRLLPAIISVRNSSVEDRHVTICHHCVRAILTTRDDRDAVGFFKDAVAQRQISQGQRIHEQRCQAISSQLGLVCQMLICAYNMGSLGRVVYMIGKQESKQNWAQR